MFRTSEHCTTLNSAIILLIFVRESGPCENKSIKRDRPPIATKQQLEPPPSMGPSIDEVTLGRGFAKKRDRSTDRLRDMGQ